MRSDIHVFNVLKIIFIYWTELPAYLRCAHFIGPHSTSTAKLLETVMHAQEPEMIENSRLIIKITINQTVGRYQFFS